ncbi:MAG: hypothetical protein Q4F34_04425 [Prevotellaceae bacterium]|nr:hypothetical protein [Prevotellaceae bacterium]
MKIDVNKELKEGCTLSEGESWEEHFKDFAKELMNNHCIKVGSDEYHFLELEFYYYDDKEHKDDDVNSKVYPRICKAEQLFVHYSGFDIAFESIVEGESLTRFGGILVRGLFNAQTKEVIGGPLRCLMEVFNNQKGKPKFGKRKKSEKCVKIVDTKRIGIKSSEKYRFVREDYWDKEKFTFTMKRCVYDNRKPVYKDKSYTYKFNQEG